MLVSVGLSSEGCSLWYLLPSVMHSSCIPTTDLSPSSSPSSLHFIPALQFPLGHPAVTTVIPGGKCVAEVESNCSLMNIDIPAQLWEDLKSEGLLPQDVRVPGPR